MVLLRTAGKIHKSNLYKSMVWGIAPCRFPTEAYLQGGVIQDMRFGVVPLGGISNYLQKCLDIFPVIHISAGWWGKNARLGRFCRKMAVF